MTPLPPAPWIEEADARALMRRLLPRYYFTADAAAGGALEAALGALASSFAELRRGVAALYDDLFVETCPSWLLPHLAEQVGIPLLPGRGNRAWVGHGVALRRRQGTRDALVRACRLASGWHVEVTPGASAVAANASLAFPGARGGYARVTGEDPAGATRSVAISGRPARDDPRRVGEGTWPHPAVVRISAWRTRALWMEGGDAGVRDVAGVEDGRARTFHGLGVDTPLFDPGPPPRPLTRAELARALARGGPLPFWISSSGETIPARDVTVADLAEWASAGAGRVAVDPVRGRLLFRDDPGERVEVGFAYGSPGDVGAGPYPRPDRARLAPTVVVGTDGVSSLDEALPQATAGGSDGAFVVVTQSRTYRPVAAEWHLAVPPGRHVRIAAEPGTVPVLDGSLVAVLGRGASLELEGLAVARELVLSGAGIASLAHCTVAPGAAGVSLSRGATLSVEDSITGRIRGTDGAPVTLRGSVVDGAGTDALGSEDAPLPSVSLERCTILGGAYATLLYARDSIFTSVVEPEPLQELFLDNAAAPDARATSLASTRYGDPRYCKHVRPQAGVGACARGGDAERLRSLAAAAAEFLPADMAWSIELVT